MAPYIDWIQIGILVSLALELVLLGGLVFCGHSHVLASLNVRYLSKVKNVSGEPAELPEAVMIVPVAGEVPGMKACLESLLDQEYPNYKMIFVTRDMEDPAAAIIQEMLSDGKNAQHILGGPATLCGQKNQNLLAGIAAAGPSADILVFCDSSHQAHPSLLHELIMPIAQENAFMTTGFHRIVPGDFGVATLGTLCSVLCIHMLQGIRIFTQPWGGATAIRRTVFEIHGVDRLWAENIVDDFSMGPFLRKKGIRCKPVSAACLTTPLAGQTLYEWNTWLTRQILYMKFCTPGAWLAAALAAYLLVAPIFLAGATIFGSLFGLFSWSMALAGLGFFILFTGIGIWCRVLVPEPVPLGPWVATFFTLHFMAFWCYIKTWFRNTLSWKGVSYRVTWGGKVKKVIWER